MKKFAKLISLAIALMLLACAFVACSAPAEPNAPAEKEKLVIATSPDFPPFESLDGLEVVGIEIDILKKVAEALDMELVIEQLDFDSVIPGVQAGKFDVGVSGITVTEERKENVDFSDPYFLASQAIVVTKDSAITGKADLEGKKISVQTGTTAEQYCMENGYETLAFVANNDAASALTSGKVDAWVVDNEVAIALAAQQDLVVLDEPMTVEPYAFAFEKGGDLVEKFNAALNTLLEDGTVAALFEQYGAAYVSPIA